MLRTNLKTWRVILLRKNAKKGGVGVILETRQEAKNQRHYCPLSVPATPFVRQCNDVSGSSRFTSRGKSPCETNL